MRTFKIFTLFCLLLLPPALHADDIAFPTAPLGIKTHDATLRFTVEVATTPEQEHLGLMHRKSLAEKHGMIFIFTPAQHVGFWMKDTLIPLDMLFVDVNGIVTGITENAIPESTRILPSPGKIRAVIELMGGSAKRYHIAPGDKIIYPTFP